MKRRDFLKLSATSLGALGAVGAGATSPTLAAESSSTAKPAKARGKSKYNGEYSGARLNRVAFPMGGMGAGMICLEGSGGFFRMSRCATGLRCSLNRSPSARCA